MRHKTIIQFIFLLFISLLFSCKDDEVIIPDPIVEPETPSGQYGTPMEDIPETEDLVLYEVNLRAFSSSGDLQGVIDRLDFIDQLGVNAIWLMPIHPIGQINSVNSPYSVKNYKAVSSEYGTLDDLRTLTDEAHARGIAVLMDWVANHTAWDNEWISNKSWYTQDASGNIIHPAGTNWQDVADLNYDNMEMRDSMIAAIKYWAYEANVDGFRCDYADGVPFGFWQQAWDTLTAMENRQFILLAEGTRSDHFDAGFDMNFSWQFYDAMKNVYDGQSVSKIFTAHSTQYNNLADGKHWLRFTTNHDESAWDATPISLFNGIDGALAASVATIFTGGVPLIYAGQEVGTANNVPFFSNSVTNWDNNPEMRTAYEQVFQCYNQSEAARKGSNKVYEHTDIACFKKTYNNESLLIIINMRNNQINFDIPAELQNSNWTNCITDEAMMLQRQLTLEAYSYFILK